MLSQTAEHALRAILFLARQTAGARVSAESIAGALGAPRNYLSKTLGTLAREGLITSARGPNGGFRLEVPAGELTVSRVVRLFDEAPTGTVCLVGGRKCDAGDPCEAHARWAAVRQGTLAPLERTTIAELLGGPVLPGSGSEIRVA